MKADIFIPSPIFEAAEQLAQRLGMSLSEFYTAALAAYAPACQRDDVTEARNRIYETELSAIDSLWVKVQVASLAGEAGDSLS
jgi:hypothetical protein